MSNCREMSLARESHESLPRSDADGRGSPLNPTKIAAFFERIAELKSTWDEIPTRAVVYPFVHRPLAQMYGELGYDDRAVEHWNLFLEVFTDPDPELEYMVTEAREALAELAREG